MLTARALGWQFRKGVYRFCATNIGRDIVRHSLQSHAPFHSWMSVHCRSPFLGANFHVNLLFFMEMPLSMLDLISMHSATDGCCSLWYSHFVFQEPTWQCCFNSIPNLSAVIHIFSIWRIESQKYLKYSEGFLHLIFVQHVIIPIGITFRNVSIGRENIPPFVSNWAVTRARASCGACGTTTLALALVTAQLDTHGGICFPSLFRRIGMLYSLGGK